MKIVATTLLPAVDRPNADRWNSPKPQNPTDIIYFKLKYYNKNYIFGKVVILCHLLAYQGILANKFRIQSICIPSNRLQTLATKCFKTQLREQ